jgi:endoglucanase
MSKRIIASLLLLAFNLTILAQQIRLNQIGFYANAQKIAIVTESPNKSFSIINTINGLVEYSDSLTIPKNWTSSGENVSVADFSAFNKTGSFYIKVGDSQSYTFPISQNDLYRNLTVWSIKGFYLWRASIKIDSTYAQFGNTNFARKAGHLDNNVLIHESAASKNRPAGTIVSDPKGWYDAGDYNLYTVNASQAVFSLLQLYENYSSIFDTLPLHIPESNNHLPDVLDEVKWETDWLLGMLNPDDSSVYSKLTSLHFCGMISPDGDKLPRYMISHSTPATLDFVAMMAKASRVFHKFDVVYADSMLVMAKKAYAWALRNPCVYYKNPAGVTTGGYGDNDASDEFMWARTELYITTGDSSYFKAADIEKLTYGIPFWRTVQTLGLLSLYQSLDTLALSATNKKFIETTVNSIANNLVTNTNTSAYRTAIDFFAWGSNGYTAAQGQILLTAYKHTKDRSYLNAGISILDYLLGRNATGYCFISGFGLKSPLNLHDRRSEGDRINAPLPGYLVGGPNTNAQRDCGSLNYPSKFPAKSYLDLNCSFSTNEIAINWQGPFAFLAGAIYAELNTVSTKR